ncbi:MAG: hypothetical protein GOMPHAMPRED_008222 [Gomphillus americanus]|uniref:Uncharacterized protein n=1 Tax=Gomphillus americanus TaxID=1940652 RepID=A0A8H3F5F5_9LECA|nr:MAG: hypothetical protein GOMPHAMPRED_008222 [Gomphillus americanus]
MNPSNTSEESQKIETGNNDAALGSQAQNTSIAPSAAASRTLTSSPSARLLSTPSPLELGQPLITPEELTLVEISSEASLDFPPLAARRSMPANDIVALWERDADKERIQALWRDPIEGNKSAACEKILGAWACYDLSKPLPGTRANDPKKRLQFRYEFKSA